MYMDGTLINKILLLLLYEHICIKQLKQIQYSNTRFRSLSVDMMTGFIQAAVVGAGHCVNVFQFSTLPCCIHTGVT